MKYTVKFLILLGIFIGSIYFFGSNMDEAMFGSVKTAEMSEAELPTIELQSDGVVVNKLYGYTSAVDAFSVREHLVAVEEEQTVVLLIDENKTDVRKMHYEVLDVNTRAEIAEGTINAFDKEADKKKARIKIPGKMESGQEYAVELMLVDSESRRIYYYFRVKYYENSEFAEKAYPMVDVKATLFDGSYHDVDSSEMAFKIAASLALKEAKNKCKPVLLEPIMKVQVIVPDEYLGNVMGDITSRRGRPMGQESRGNALAIDAMVPLAEMFGYATSLRSNTQGRGNFTMVLDHYEEVPKSIAEEIIKKNGGN